MGNREEYKERVVLDPTVHLGKPCVAGTRIPVEDVLELIQEGIPFSEITKKYGSSRLRQGNPEKDSSDERSKRESLYLSPRREERQEKRKWAKRTRCLELKSYGLS